VFGGLQSFALAVAGQKHNELFAPKACDDVVFATVSGLQNAGELNKHPVAGDVAMSVVEVFEVVDIGHDERDGRAIECGLSPRLFQAIVEVTAVCKAGKAISKRELGQIVVDARKFLGAKLFAKKQNVSEPVGELDAIVRNGRKDGTAGDKRERTNFFAVREKYILSKVGAIGEEERCDERKIEREPHTECADGRKEQNEVDLRVDAGDRVIDRSGSDAAGRRQQADGKANSLVEGGMTPLSQNADGERGAGGKDTETEDRAVPDVARVKTIVDKDEQQNDERTQRNQKWAVVVAKVLVAVVARLELSGKAQPQRLLRPRIEKVRELKL
jgi:hypothetical protein